MKKQLGKTTIQLKVSVLLEDKELRKGGGVSQALMVNLGGDVIDFYKVKIAAEYKARSESTPSYPTHYIPI